MYIAFKHLHMTFAVLSIAGFILRGTLLAVGSNWSQSKIFKITPHIIDTVLLLSAIALMITLSIYPFYNASWLSAKVVGLIGYIGFGTVALKAGRPTSIRIGAFFAALCCVGYIFAVAFTKNPLLGL